MILNSEIFTYFRTKKNLSNNHNKNNKILNKRYIKSWLINLFMLVSTDVKFIDYINSQFKTESK